MRFLSTREGRPAFDLGAKGFALHSFADTHSASAEERPRGVSWVCLHRQREKSAHLRRHPLAILFSTWGRHSPARKAGMTGTHLRMSQAGNAGIQLFPLFLFAQTPKGFGYIKYGKENRHEVSRSLEARRPLPQRHGFHEAGAEAAPGPQAQGDHPRRGGGTP